MAMTLSFTDGTTTVNLNDGPGTNTCAIMKDGYAPKAAMAQDTTIDDRADVEFQGISTGRTRINSLNAIFARARQRASTGLGPRCFVQFKYDGSDTTQRSEILDGAIDVDSDTMGVAYAAGEIRATVDFTRMPYWEGSLTQLAISNTNASNNTSGLAVGNHGSSQSCWFTVTGSDIVGDCDAPVQMRLAITAGTIGYVLIGQLNGTASYTSNGFYQGETALGSTGSGTSSGGNYGAHSATGATTTGTATWAVTGTTCTYTNGKSVLPVVRFASAPAQMYLNMVIAGTKTEWVQTSTSRQYVIFPPAPLPSTPLDTGYASTAAYFYLNAWNAGATSTLQIDYIALLPTDGWRELISSADQTSASTSTIYDDGIEQQTYLMASGTDKYGVFSSVGRWPMITPGVGQSFYVLSSALAGSMAIDITYSAKLYYRPRRRSI